MISQAKIWQKRLSLVIISSQVIYIPGVGYNIFIQIFQVICAYSSHQGDTIWPFLVDMAKRVGRVGSNGSQVKRVTGQKRVILSGLKSGSGQSGCGSGRVDPYFSHEIFYFFYFLFFIFFIKKTICICHLDSYATYYLM